MVEKKPEDLDKTFKDAQDFIQNYKDPKVSLNNNEKLRFYSLYKQGTFGECTGPQPSRLKLIERAKYDAWKSLGKMSSEDAKKTFIEELKKKIPAYAPKL
ncbi:acyl--binding protein [Stylonychia lemnae]|uniref:Acyl--binding protein n=1 Tax=Stylonychia lemnae TaxID=5949 RepID=A0A078B5T3_STYLE|nr:acyl--binding protein [Stylonychia lemnae]|eukprot:CDW89784.1 acyl--binding protein [Stylonychia lemnae]